MPITKVSNSGAERWSNQLQTAISNSSSRRTKPNKSYYLHHQNKTKQQFWVGRYKPLICSNARKLPAGLAQIVRRISSTTHDLTTNN